MTKDEFVRALADDEVVDAVVRHSAPGYTERPGYYHRLWPMLDDEWDVRWRIECPFEADELHRSCLLVEEAPGCLWLTWQDGGHHPDCPGPEGCTSRDVEGIGIVQHCWADAGIHGEPECDGLSHPLLGHAHPVSGCGMAQTWSEVGPEGVALDLGALDLGPVVELTSLPLLVDLAWVDGEYLRATPVLPDRVDRAES